MTVRFRATLDALPTYVPGRTIAGAVKLASNESAYGPLPFVIDRIAAVAATANRYPDTFSTELRHLIAARLAVPPEQVVVGCGSVSLCQQLVLATAGTGDEVLFGWRSFEAYPIISILGGARPVQVALTDDRYDLTAMAAAISERTRLIFICNPNNPTSTILSREELVWFLDQVPADVLVVLDEAYIEYVVDERFTDGLSLLSRYRNLIVLRTFSKAYGLAALRIGYGIAADPAVAAAAVATQSPFAVTAVAQAAAAASLEPEAEAQMRHRVSETVTERARVTAALRAAGYFVPESHTNFVWLNRIDNELDPVAFAATCERGGVIVRPFADSGVRISIGSPTENDAFLNTRPAR
jgi:histidinol-phosphate aminotransferase